MNDYWKKSARRPHDGLLCIDQQGNLLQINPTASHIFGIPEMSNTLDACPSMKHILLPLVRQTHPRSEPHEHQFFCARSDKHLNVTTFPIIREGQTIGAIALVPGQDATGSSCNQCKDRVVDSAEEKITRRTRLNRVQARYSFENILGEVGEVKRALELAKLAATNSLPVLITGESGTGKELFAQAIHNTNRRARHSFVVVNCGAIPHELIEAELFGYESGAFTGAKPGGSAGKFESADGGTIFLDEVSELSHSAQVALLRVLQEMEIVRLGSSLPTAIDVRVIAASNKDLSQEVNARRFRRDLYYRLNVMHIDLPPLRQRQDDIPLLVNHMLQMVAREFGQLQFTLDPEVIELLRAYHWPGNIRELKNVIQRAAALSKGSLICLKDLPTEVKAAKSEEAAGESHGWPSIKHLERELLVETLQACSGNVTEAAHRLHLSRVTLHRKMRKYSITRQDFLGMRPHADDHATKT
jgi:transcriptional regulator with PAS, ATPase and Fis domain